MKIEHKWCWPDRMVAGLAIGWTLAVLVSFLAEAGTRCRAEGALRTFSSNNSSAQRFVRPYLEFLKSDRTWSLLGHGGVWIAGLAGIGLARCLLLRHARPLETAARREREAETRLREREQEMASRDQQLAAFHRISEIMQADSAKPEVFNAIAREISEMTGFPVVAIELCDFKRALMLVRGSHGIALDDLPDPLEVPMDVTPSGEVARTGQLLVESHAPSRREYAAPFLKELRAEVFVCAPIKIQGRIAGTLSLAHRQPISIEPSIVKQIESLANYLATLFGGLDARQAAHQGAAELAAVYDRAPSVMCLFDQNMNIIRANRAALEFAGRRRADATPVSAAEFFQCLDGNKKNNRCFASPVCQACELCRAVSDTFRSGKGWQRVRVKKLIARNEQPEEAVVLVSTERLRVDGATRVLMCLEDVTGSERADEQIRSQAALLDITRDAILVRDFDDRILYWNEGAHRMYGWTAAEVLNKTMSEVLLGNDPEPAAEAMRVVREKEDWTGEMKHCTRQGADLTVQSRWTLVRDRNGKPKAILVVSSDITERNRLEAQLLRAQRLESIGTLASGLAHDLNNVLAPIMMATQFLMDETTDDTTRTWVQTLDTCSRRGADIVRQVLTFARGVEGQRLTLQPKHLVQEMERIIRETFPKSIEVAISFCKQPWMIRGDATQMQQVLMNLCVNARDAMPDGGTLTLSVDKAELNGEALSIHPKAQCGRYAVISVADTGTGIAPELMDKIFDPFFTTKPLGYGTGLGLPTVLGIVENHGGFVVVESQPGKGTVFKVYLPAAQLEKPSKAAPQEVAVPKGKGELVLVVDDEPSIRKITYVILTKNGYEAFLAADGREALELFKQHQDAIKLVVTDLMMPKLDGPSTIRALHEIRPDIKTITITGLGEENRIGEAKAAGSDDFLNKPFSAEQLLLKIHGLLKGNASRHQAEAH
jgi:PAS domain S-box-containing protein